jgi:hypothetical protein
MKRTWLIALAATVLLAPIGAVAAPLPGVIVANPQQAAQTVTIRDVQSEGNTVSGVVTNRSPDVIRNVGLLIRHTWFWSDERHPGEYNPGRASFYTVRGPIPPGGSVPFEYHMSEPPPVRADGRFATTVEVMTFTDNGSAQASR